MAKMGAPKKTLTKEQKELAKGLYSYGVPYLEVAKAVKVSWPTLKKIMGEELKLCAHKRNLQVAEALFNSAVKKGNVTAQIFYLKTRMGWKEVSSVEHVGEGTPVIVVKQAKEGKQDWLEKRSKEKKS